MLVMSNDRSGGSLTVGPGVNQPINIFPHNAKRQSFWVDCMPLFNEIKMNELESDLLHIYVQSCY